ncbi:MAG TPA: DUF1330 domain-containing protein [Myxococcota bacterium]|jgi:uncharacterized protein (DUF1330 family)
MAAYVIFMNDITDPAGYAAYLDAARPTLAAHPGKLRVFADETQVLEGTPDHKRCIVIEFPDRASAEAWYRSAAYQKAIPLRQAASRGWGFVVDSLPG